MAFSRKAALVACALATLFGCSFGSFGYLSSESSARGEGGAGSDAGAVAGAAGVADDGPCTGRDDGALCDDRDVCSHASICVSGRCEGSGPSPCSVADSIRDFSMTQGLEGWWYGYFRAGTDQDGSYQPASDFQPLTACPANTWRPTCVEPSDPAFRWTQITAELMHAAAEPELQLPVRRWVSDVSGPAIAVLDDHHADPGDGDGTRASLLLDGALVWENELGGADALGVQVTIPITLELGDTVELMLHPRANQARDMTYYSLVIEGR